MCFACRLRCMAARVPIVIHDIVTPPGLTNRLLAPLAKHIATGRALHTIVIPKNLLILEYQ